MANLILEVDAEAVRKGTRLRADESVKKALWRAGSVISNQIKVNIRNNGMVETGNLLRSIGFEVQGSGDSVSLTVGAFNNAYAHINEFGSNNVTDRMRKAMFARLREQSIPRRPSKNVMIQPNFQARPFVGPALVGHSDRMMAFLRDAIRESDLF